MVINPNDPEFRPLIEADPIVGSIIRGLRLDLGQGLSDLASGSGVDESTLAQIEAGTFDPPWPILEGIACALGTSPSALAAAVVSAESESSTRPASGRVEE